MAIRAADRFYRLFYWAAFRAARVWWWLRDPWHDGVLVGIWADDRVLLVRQSYRSEWSMPGGGMWKGETPAETAVRELREELRLSIAADDLEPAGEMRGRWDFRTEHVRVFALRPRPPFQFEPDRREIIEARFFAPIDALSLRLTGPARTYLAETASLVRPPAECNPKP